MRRDDRRHITNGLRPFPPPALPEHQRRDAVNAARLDRLTMADPAPFLHAHTMAEIAAVAEENGISFSDAYALHKRAIQARWGI